MKLIEFTRPTLADSYPGKEDRFTSEFSTWLWNDHPLTRLTITHIENEKEPLGGESKQSFMRRLSKARAKGVVPGWWDFIWHWAGKTYYIELKVGKGSLSDEQKKVRDALSLQCPDLVWVVLYNMSQAKEFVCGVLG